MLARLSSPWKERRGLGSPTSLVGFKPPAGCAGGQDQEMGAAPSAFSQLPKALELWGSSTRWRRDATVPKLPQPRCGHWAVPPLGQAPAAEAQVVEKPPALIFACNNPVGRA